MRVIAFLALLLLQQSSNSSRSLDDRLWRHRNLGKAFYENPTTQLQAVDEFKHALDLAPNSTREQINYALALLRAGRTREAVDRLIDIQKSAPALPHTWFNLGIVWKKEGDFAKALPQFEHMVKLTPDEPVARYNYAVLLKQHGRTGDAIAQLLAAVELNPFLAAPHFQLYNLYRAAARKEDAAREIAEFQKLKKSQEGAAIPEDMEWCDYAEIYDPPEALPPAPASPPKYSERILPGSFPANEPRGYVNADGLLVWSYKQTIAPHPGLEYLHQIRSVSSGDFDNDGYLDLAVVTASGISLCRNQPSAQPLRRNYACTEFLKGAYNSTVWLDYDHDYDLDLFAFGPDSKLMRNQGSAGFADRTPDFPFGKGNALSGWQTRIVPDSKSFDLVVNYDGPPTRIVHRDKLNGVYQATDGTSQPSEPRDPLAPWVEFTANGKAVEKIPAKPASWIGIQLVGVKNMKLAQGAVVEVKSGLLYQKKTYQGLPLLFDLRNYKEADTVRITWPNGMIQNEMKQAANKAYAYKEAQRLSGSCPMIWTWDGSEFRYITDVLGIAPLGASSGDGAFFPTDHDEYVMIPAHALALKDGAFDIRITEELSEVSYIDQFLLFAVDHPSSHEIFVNEKWKSPPFPEFRFYSAAQRIYPRTATGSNGRNVLPLVTAADRQYPTEFRRTESGSAETHSLTLDFSGAAKDNRAVLILHGWVDWADGSTFKAVAQESKTGLVPPYLQVKDAAGQWRTVIDDMGMPDGKPKTITVDLTGKFLSDSREVRIVTNLCVYWDEIFLSESSAPPQLRHTQLPLESAAVRFRGFSESKIHPQRTQPEQFFYANTSPFSFWNPTPGLYTRYGDVTELLETPDDRFVIIGAGDEIRMRFNPNSLPPVAAGWRRDYLLKIDGWAKDRDANTAFSQTVEPLPFHQMSTYPYPSNEHYPSDAAHRAYRDKYNTRPALRLIRPLVGTN